MIRPLLTFVTPHPRSTTLFRLLVVTVSLLLVSTACNDKADPEVEHSPPRPLADADFDTTVEPGVGRVLEANADHPAAEAIEGFYADYLAFGSDAAPLQADARLASFEYSQRADVGSDMAQSVDALLAEASEGGIVADPFFCSTSLPTKVSPIKVSEVDDRVMVRMQARHPESNIPQMFTAEAMLVGDTWQLVAVTCR